MERCTQTTTRVKNNYKETLTEWELSQVAGGMQIPSVFFFPKIKKRADALARPLILRIIYLLFILPLRRALSPD